VVLRAPIAAACAAAFWSGVALAGGPWSPAAGEYYASASAQRFVSRAYVDGTQQVVELEGGRFEGDLWALYGEVGLGRGLSLQAFVPYAAARTVVDEPRTVYAYRFLGDVEAGLRYGARPGGVPVSIAVLAKVPGYPTALDAPELVPVLGDGQVDVTGWLAIGGSASVGSVSLWGYAESGVRVRTAIYPFASVDHHDPDESWVWHAQGGVGPGWGGWWVVDVQGVHALGNDPRTRQLLQLSSGLAAPVARIGEAGPQLLVEGGGGLVPWARAGGTGWSARLGLSLKR
jgi:hypothetical protein